MNTQTLYKNFLWVIAILFSLSLAVSFFYQNEKPVGKLDVAGVIEKIKSGEVEKITVSGNRLELVARGGALFQAQKESEASFTETLKNYGVAPEALSKIKLEVKDDTSRAFWLGVILPTVLPLLVIIGIFWFIMRQARGGINQAFTFGRVNLKMFTNMGERVTFADVAGLKEPKQELVEIVDFLKEPKKYLDIGAKIPRGVLLMGPPGSGKTLLARAVAGEAKVPFFYISASEFVEMFVGVGASRIRDSFATAKRAAPSILFIDEIDAVGRERGAGLGGGHDEREQTLNQILVEMDGFDRTTQVIILAATNRPDVLDVALLRPGRFDRRIVLDLPDINEREAILNIHAKNKPLDKDVDFRKVATRTPGFSGADLANLINEAAILAVQEKKKSVGQSQLYESIEKVILGPARKSRLISDKERGITAYHEAGHALVAASLKDSDPVHKVSIISRGRAGGYTLKLPLEDQRLKTRSQFLADLAVALGGHASEKIIFKDITTGASNDLKEATNLARLLVTRYGMSEKMGPMTFGNTEELIFLGREIATEKNYSDAVATQIDAEVRAFIDRAYKAATKIISSKRDALTKIAKALLEKETLESEEFYALVKPFNLPAARRV
ncbi:MAG: ATP-dependent metallopeptidase FtsH/Yme1/Tma family protein [Candidatus Colwellbacteria bacterium]|nr:ATP-dependent metallopeptidase FtsH/Yme1/Tma family protein [Candidatus Colwellbacteria bacterium]